MDNKGLIFIPDISGFTKFMHETELEHSEVIIQELLETIINANNIGLEISEIEGDAILFYKFGPPPAMDALYKQVEKMFHDFHRYLQLYDMRRICQCEACKSASGLTLKVVSHYGEFKSLNIKNFAKSSANLHGKDIIIAHQLMKNDIDLHEYWLVTDSLMPESLPDQMPDWLTWNNSAKHSEHGSIPYQYTHLTPLKDEIPPATDPNLEIANRVKVLSFTKEYDTDINNLFFTSIDFNQRANWRVGIKKTDQVSTPLPQVGTRHRCILEKGQLDVNTSSFSYTPDKIIYSETDVKKKFSSYNTYEKISENKTRLTIDLYLKKNPVISFMFNLAMKKKFEKEFKQSMENLDALLKSQQAESKHKHLEDAEVYVENPQ
ncbi:MAG TPA: DUF2652 domain-containing protein [Chitinophagaceae bacterium]|nr:DUF2652 domain-containing protein [Chitinophagaceae bacterium]